MEKFEARMEHHREFLKENLQDVESKIGRIVVGATCCYRFAPTYATFQRVSGWGCVNVIYNSLNKIVSSSLTKEDDDFMVKIESSIQRCFPSSVGTINKRPLQATYLGELSCLQLLHLIKFVREGNLSSILSVLELACYFCLDEEERRADGERWYVNGEFDNSDLFKKEIKIQKNDLIFVAKNQNYIEELNNYIHKNRDKKQNFLGFFVMESDFEFCHVPRFDQEDLSDHSKFYSDV